MTNMKARPCDMNVIPGYSGDYRTLDKLINGINITIKDENMWLIPFVKAQNHQIFINFDEPKAISGIKIWNYNKNPDDSYRGVKQLTVSGDGILLTPAAGVLIRKAPALDIFDFGQFISLPYTERWNDDKIALYKQISFKSIQNIVQVTLKNL